MKGDIIRARVASLKPPYVFRKQLIVWCLTLVKGAKYELPKFHTFMKAASPLPSAICRSLRGNIPFTMSLIPGAKVISGITKLYHFCNVLEDNFIKSLYELTTNLTSSPLLWGIRCAASQRPSSSCEITAMSISSYGIVSETGAAWCLYRRR